MVELGDFRDIYKIKSIVTWGQLVWIQNTRTVQMCGIILLWVLLTVADAIGVLPPHPHQAFSAPI